jgi:hypothetical protein
MYNDFLTLIRSTGYMNEICKKPYYVLQNLKQGNGRMSIGLSGIHMSGCYILNISNNFR